MFYAPSEMKWKRGQTKAGQKAWKARNPGTAARSSRLDQLALAAKSSDASSARAARDELVTAMLPALRNVAQIHAARNDVEFDDVMQEASIGLLRGIEKWKPGGARFVTFVGFWLHACAARVGMRNTHSGSKTARAQWREHLSLDDTQSEEDDSLHERVGRAAQQHDVLEQKETTRALRAAVRGLPMSERDVLRRRAFGEETLEQVGDVRGLSRERIRQIEKKAMRRLRLRLLGVLEAA